MHIYVYTVRASLGLNCIYSFCKKVKAVQNNIFVETWWKLKYFGEMLPCKTLSFAPKTKSFWWLCDKNCFLTCFRNFFGISKPEFEHWDPDKCSFHNDWSLFMNSEKLSLFLIKINNKCQNYVICSNCLKVSHKKSKL